MIMSTENVGQTALAELLEQHRGTWESFQARALTNSYFDINNNGMGLNCEKRRAYGWITADEECSTGNSTQALITSFSTMGGGKE